MTNIVEVDISYLTGQTIGILPARSRKTIQFSDRGNDLSNLIRERDRLQKLGLETELHMCRVQNRFFRFFLNWRHSAVTREIARIGRKICWRTERRLSSELMSSREVRSLVRQEHDRSEFLPLDARGRHEILQILNDPRRLIQDDWVQLRFICIEPKSQMVLALI